MAKTEYIKLKVESYIPENMSGLHGEIHIRPLPNQIGVNESLHVTWSRKLRNAYPVGTKFLLMAALTDREHKGEYYYSHPSWDYIVLKD